MQAALSRPVLFHAPPSPADDRLYRDAATAARNAQAIRSHMQSERLVAMELKSVTSLHQTSLHQTGLAEKMPRYTADAVAGYGAGPSSRRSKIEMAPLTGATVANRFEGLRTVADANAAAVSEDVGTALLSMAPRAQALYKETLARRLASEVVEVDHDSTSDTASATSLIAPSMDGPYRLGAVSAAVSFMSRADIDSTQSVLRRADVVPEEPNVVFLVSPRPKFKRVWREGHEVRSKMAVVADPIDPFCDTLETSSR